MTSGFECFTPRDAAARRRRRRAKPGPLLPDRDPGAACTTCKWDGDADPLQLPEQERRQGVLREAFRNLLPTPQPPRRARQRKAAPDRPTPLPRPSASSACSRPSRSRPPASSSWRSRWPPGGRMIVVGDKKGPAEFDLPGGRVRPARRAGHAPLPPRAAAPDGPLRPQEPRLPRSPCRPARRCIYETDDDNAPTRHWSPRSLIVDAAQRRPAPGG